MKGTTNPVLKVFDGNHKALVIPVYQRNYDWQIKQCERLFDDLEDVIATDRKKHFFGAVVGKPEDSFTWVVIDGQQRLTTVSILMLALTHALRDGEIASKDADLADKIELDFLRIGSMKQETKFKLKPVKDDADAYRRIFGSEDDFLESSNITANYKYFRQRLKDTASSADDIWKAIQSLEVMHLDLEEYDDPQRIFESLNSTGLELREADKIRNFILMGHSPDVQERLYEDRWNPTEKNSDFETDAFIRWYLTTKNASTPREQDVYEEFKAYALRNEADSEELLDDVYEFSKYYAQIRHANTGFPKVDAQLLRMRDMMGAVVMPFLMPVLKDVHHGVTTADDFHAVLKIVESFIARRFVVNIATNALNKIFATSYSELRKLRTGEQPYADIFAYLLLRRSSSSRFPSDTEFRQAFPTRNLYNIRPQWRDYIYDVLENRESHDVRDISSALRHSKVSIEHVMPQKLTPAWRKELGPDAQQIHETWLHRIGNLTVTGYNSKYSNSPYMEKKTMPNGFDDSPYRLNDVMKEHDHWGLEQLQLRSDALTEVALEYWQMPTTEFAPPEVALPSEPMGEDASFRGLEIVSFQFGDLNRTVWSWAEMQQELLIHLMRNHRTEILELVPQYVQLKALPKSGEAPSGWRKIDDSAMVLCASDTDSKLNFLRSLFEKLGLDPEELVFSYKPTKEDEVVAPSPEPEQDERVDAPYAPLTKFIARFEEAAQLQYSFEDTAPLREDFRHNVAQFTEQHGSQVKPLDSAVMDFVRTRSPESATPEQAVAVASGFIELGEWMLHDVIVSGTLVSWMRALER